MEFIYPQATSLGKNMNITNKWSNIMIIKNKEHQVECARQVLRAKDTISKHFSFTP